MDPTEFFGLRIARLAERVRARRSAPSACAVDGAPLVPRLRLLAGLVAGRPLDVRLTEEPGGWSGDTLLLPERIDALDDAGLNEAAYIYRTAYGATSCRLGLCVEHDDPWRRWCRTLLAVPATRRALFLALPAARDLEASLRARLLERRNERPARMGRPGVLEILCRIRLGAHPALATCVEPAGREWLEAAVSFEGTSPGEAEALTDALFRVLPRGGGRTPPCPVPLWGELLAPRRGGGSQASVPNDPARTLTRELESGRRLGLIERREGRDSPRSPLFHHFEKIETLQEHDGVSTRGDEPGDPETERGALERMRPRRLLRSRERSDACYRIDAVLEGTGLTLEPGCAEAAPHRYPEWHHGKGRYRADWCALYEVRGEGADSPGAESRAQVVLRAQHASVEALRRRLEEALLARVPRRRQPDGPEVDLDAAVDRIATLSAGHTPGNGLYIDRRRGAPDLAVWILLDHSLSSDSWVAGRRILEVGREAVLVLGEALDGLIPEVGIACFSSNTRQLCRFLELKGPCEPWGLARGRLMAVEPAGYTRIGPAIRHAAVRLGALRARRRLLLLVSDARPSDYDQYEGRYGVEDVAQAVRECQAAGILCHALAVESGAEERLVGMLGAGRFHVLQGPRLLPEVLTAVLGRLRI